MVTRFKFPAKGSRSAQDDREALVHEEVRFLLQGNDARFARQLRARLLEEGCNLPLVLARPIFYRQVVGKLSAALDDAGKAAFNRRFDQNGENLLHARFLRQIRFLHARLPAAQTKMASAAVDAVAAVLETWRLDEGALTTDPATFESVVRQMVARMTAGNPSGRLAALPFDVVLRRLRTALGASLLRYNRDTEGFQVEFGSIPGIFKAMQIDPVVFCRLMSFVQGQLPYFGHVASQSFWRTLNNLDAEKDPPSASIGAQA